MHAGHSFAGPCAEERDGAGLMIMPGLINLHTHSATMPVLKGIREDMANPSLYMSALYDGWNLFPTPPERKRWNTAYAYGEMLRSGVTTVLDMCYPFPGWVDVAEESGLRCFLGGLFQSAPVVDHEWPQSRLHLGGRRRRGGHGGRSGVIEEARGRGVRPARRCGDPDGGRYLHGGAHSRRGSWKASASARRSSFMSANR